MKIISVMNQKGGIGKTMTAASVAYILGVEHEKRVLVVDADQQGNISMLYGRYEPDGRGTPELLEGSRRSILDRGACTDDAISAYRYYSG